MKVLGIIAEYNPMHSGHIYHINKSKKILGCDYTIAIMSGNFTEQGNIAIIDKFTRAKQAIKNGIDLVIELPTIYAVSDAGSFANKAVSILNDLNAVDYLSFGSETDNIESITHIANTILDNEHDIWNLIKENLKLGISFANARARALANFLTNSELDIINSPNNILGIEYVKSLISLNSSIKPICIKRQLNNFNNENITPDFTSSTSIRKHLLENKDISLIKDYLPEDVLQSILNKNLLFNKNIFELLKYKITIMSKEELKNIVGVTEGLENKIIKEIISSFSYDEYIHKLKSKRYELSKIKRIVINILLNISKDDFISLCDNSSNYAHVLAFNHDKKELISYISKKSNIPIITSLNNTTLKKLTDNQAELLSYDLLASNIYSLLVKNNLNKDYTNRL